MATQNPDLVGPEEFGISGNFGTFQGAYAFSVSAMGVIGHDVFQQGDRVAVSGGAGLGFATGQGDNEHWQDELWEFRNFILHAVATSISGISLEEMRKGFDPVVHEMVDAIFENRRLFLM